MAISAAPFIRLYGADDERGQYLRHSLNHDWERRTFYQALGELRGVFGIHIATLAVRYDLDVPDELARILPLDATESLPLKSIHSRVAAQAGAREYS